MKFPNEYPLKRYWRDVLKGASKEPDLTDSKIGFIKRIHEAPEEKRAFAFLTSMEVLYKVRRDLNPGEDVLCYL